MKQRLWGRRPPPSFAASAVAQWAWHLRTPMDITLSRGELRTAVTRGPSPGSVNRDDVDRLLLAFEELTSNGLRHGRSPVHARVVRGTDGWLITVTDGAADRAPVPATDRDPAEGGLGLYLVARLCPAHGWSVSGDRKLVWAYVGTARRAE